MNFEREKADILFDYGLLLQFCCHLIQIYTVSSLRTATLTEPKTSIVEYITDHTLQILVQAYNWA